jgi:hypothetical protein
MLKQATAAAKAQMVTIIAKRNRRRGTCPICGDVFPSKNAMRQHRETHDARPYEGRLINPMSEKL